MRLVGERRPAEAGSSSGTGETIDACVSELERPLSMGESSGGAEEDAARAAGLTMTRSDAEEAAATELGVIDAEEAAATELGVILSGRERKFGLPVETPRALFLELSTHSAGRSHHCRGGA